MIKNISIENYENVYSDIEFSLDHKQIKSINVTIFRGNIYTNSVRIAYYDIYGALIRNTFFDYDEFISELKTDLEKYWSPMLMRYKYDQNDINYINVYLKKYFLYKGLY